MNPVVAVMVNGVLLLGLAYRSLVVDGDHLHA
jgi:hypothetical protein